MIKELGFSKELVDLIDRGVATLIITENTVIPTTKQLTKLHLSGVDVKNHNFVNIKAEKSYLEYAALFSIMNYDSNLDILEESTNKESIVTSGIVEQVVRCLVFEDIKSNTGWSIKYDELPPFNILLIRREEDKYVVIAYLKD